MKFLLIVAKGSKRGTVIPINVDLFLIGSDRMCQLRKDNLGTKHCALMMREDKVFICDMDSGQATVVNGSVMSPGAEWPLHAGDRIAVGSLEFVVQFEEEGLSGKDLEEWAMHTLDQNVPQEVEEEAPMGKPRSAAAAAASILNQLNAMTGSIKGRLRLGVERGVNIVRFNDEMLVEEAEIALIKKELREMLNRPNMRVLLDLNNVRKLSTSAVMMLFDLYRWLQQSGSKLAFCRIRPELESALSMVQSENVPIFVDKKMALSEKW